jgi:hypothetical protein
VSTPIAAARPPAFRPPADALLVSMVNGHVRSSLLTLAVELGLAGHLSGPPVGVDRLAAATGTQPALLRRVLRALASLGVVAETEDGLFAATDLTRALGGDAVRPVGNVLLWLGSRDTAAAVAALGHTLRTGGVAFDHVHGTSYWEWLEGNPDAQRVFRAAQDEFEAIELPAILGSADFSRFSSIVDVGGSRGGLLTTVLERNPAARGVIFDLPSAVAGVEERLRHQGLADRCRVQGGDFFEEVPAGHDAYILRRVLHDWGDEPALRILRSCARAMSPTATLLLVERLTPERVTPSPLTEATMLIDMIVLAKHGGKQRSESELGDLFDAAGLALAEVHTHPMQLSVVEARRRV